MTDKQSVKVWPIGDILLMEVMFDKPPVTKFISESDYDLLLQELKQVREIGVEMQREVNRRLSEENNRLRLALEAVDKLVSDTQHIESTPAETSVWKKVRDALNPQAKDVE